jgi:hypothetical protein
MEMFCIWIVVVIVLLDTLITLKLYI